jgi:Ca2+-binding EF-hand superfamily protein
LDKLAIAVVKYTIHYTFTDKQKDEYRKFFYWINSKSDGMLSREELLKSYWTSGFETMSEIELDKLLTYVDDDGNGYITFPEFIVAAINPKDLMDPSRLKIVFETFDKDKSGSCARSELQEAISNCGIKISENQMKAFLADNGDEDDDGELDFDEFYEMLMGPPS